MVYSILDKIKWKWWGLYFLASNTVLEGTWREYGLVSISGYTINHFGDWTCSTVSSGLFKCIRSAAASYKTFIPADTAALSDQEKVKFKEGVEAGFRKMRIAFMRVRSNATKKEPNIWYVNLVSLTDSWHPIQGLGAGKIQWPRFFSEKQELDIERYWIKQGTKKL